MTIKSLIDTINDKWGLFWRIEDYYRSTKLFFVSKYQTFRYGASDEECWGLDYHLAKFILPRLKRLRAMDRSGLPPKQDDDGFTLGEFPKYSDAPYLTREEWDKVLDEMIFAFDFILNEEKYLKFPIKWNFDKDEEEIADRINNITEEEQRDLDKYFVELDKLQKREKRGLMLFGLYFRSLWD